MRDRDRTAGLLESGENGTDSAPPAMSVVIVTPDRYDTIRDTIEHLREQTGRDRLEIVIVAPSAKDLGLSGRELKGFARASVVETGPIASAAEARAAGVRRASAPIVAFLEDHSYPAPGWAAALIEAHEKPWAAVGPIMVNANPETLISRANVFLGNTSYVEPAAPGTVDDLPGRNSSYKRAVLLNYGPELGPLLETETVLHWDLRARGYELYLEPAAKTFHRYHTVLSVLLREELHLGRLFAASRSKGWPLAQRLLYAGGAVLVPLLRLRRIIRAPAWDWRDEPFRMLAVIITGLLVSALGEILGYALGAGDAARWVCRSEFDRDRYSGAKTVVSLSRPS